jgi:hypothetical protein
MLISGMIWQNYFPEATIKAPDYRQAFTGHLWAFQNAPLTGHLRAFQNAPLTGHLRAFQNAPLFLAFRA